MREANASKRFLSVQTRQQTGATAGHADVGRMTRIPDKSMYVYMCVYIYRYMFILMSVCIYIYIYTYIHIHMYKEREREREIIVDYIIV